MAKDAKAKAQKAAKTQTADKSKKSVKSAAVHDHPATDCALASGVAGHDDVESRAETLSKFEAELNKREVDLIEREIKSLRQQEELDRLRPLSGLYRVVRAMASERRLDS